WVCVNSLLLPGFARRRLAGRYEAFEMLPELRQQRIAGLSSDVNGLLDVLQRQVGFALSFEAIGKTVIDIGRSGIKLNVAPEGSDRVINLFVSQQGITE